MLSLIILIIALILYQKNKVYSIVLFILLAFGGSRIFPFFIGGVKCTDISIIYIIIITSINWFYNKNYFKIDSISKNLNLLALFFIISGLFSIFYYKFSIIQVLIVLRTYCYFLSYYFIRTLTPKQINKLLHLLGLITFICGIAYLIQIPLGTSILFDTNNEYAQGEDYGGLTRFTNVPPFNYLFFFLAFFSYKTYGSKSAIWNKVVYSLAILLSFGRTAIAFSFGILLLGITLTKKQYIKWVILLSIILLPAIGIISKSFSNRNSSSDIEMIINGDFRDYQTGSKSEASTMTYRVAWIYERFDYLMSQPFVEQCFGLGYISDEDKNINKYYKFQICGYQGEDDFQILYSFDIAWGNFVTRFGIIGTIIMLSIWIKFLFFFWKHKNNDIAFGSFLYIIYLFCNSIASQSISETVNMIPIFILYIIVKNQIKNNFHEDQSNNIIYSHS